MVHDKKCQCTKDRDYFEPHDGNDGNDHQAIEVLVELLKKTWLTKITSLNVLMSRQKFQNWLNMNMFCFKSTKK